jgi:hypothetical protein
MLLSIVRRALILKLRLFSFFGNKVTLELVDKNDGIGAQIHANLAMVLMAKTLGFNYIAKQPSKVQHLELSEAQYLFNEIVFKNGVCKTRESEIPQIRKESKAFNIKSRKQLFKCLFTLNKCVIVQSDQFFYCGADKIITNPRNIELINSLKFELNKEEVDDIFNRYRTDCDTYTIGVHLRRGDVSKTQNIDRFEDDFEIIEKIDYFIKVKKIQKFIVFIFTNGTVNVSYWESKLGKGIVFVFNVNLRDTINLACSVECFVMAKSSLSYVIGLLRQKDVLYTPFWHPPLHNWLIYPVKY